ncbi:histone acetyltransferase [Saccharomycopsis crataegensis]|uniref:Histone acetyltransferase n=1 Tax=Saccharomycopsis crataegensis TaxID=43959 RepID=A0AAV5QKB8_9ASCO|nr:histone acetyltransferase [Saccharomycopsis crataegensis]
MAPRNSNRSKSGRSRLFSNPSREQQPKEDVTKTRSNTIEVTESTKSSSIISKILNQVDLTYDMNVGTINGDLVYLNSLGSLSLQTLLNLKSLAKALKKNLKNTSLEDHESSLDVKKLLLLNHGVNGFTKADLEYIVSCGKSSSDYSITEKTKNEILNANGPEKTIDEVDEDLLPKDNEDQPLSAMKNKQVVEDEDDETPPRKRSVSLSASPVVAVKSEDSSLEPPSKKQKIEENSVIPEERTESATEKEVKIEEDQQNMVIPENLEGEKLPSIIPTSAHDSSSLLEATENLHLFVPDKQAEKSRDPEYLKKLYGVSTFPNDYLQDYLTGPIPDIDFNQQKEIKNKVNFNNFLSYLDHYYRPFDDDDLIFLKKKYVYSSHLDSFYANQFNTNNNNNTNNSIKHGRSPLVASTTIDSNGLPITVNALGNGNNHSAATAASYNPKIHPFIIPKLGKLYTKVWAEEDGTARMGSPSPQETINENIKDQLVPKGSGSEITDNDLEKDNISCGPLVNRLLSALIKCDDDSEIIDNDGGSTTANNNNNNNNNNDDNDEKEAVTGKIEDDHEISKNENSIFFPEYSTGKAATNSKYDYSTLEERLKRELKYVGVYLNYKNEMVNKKKSGDDNSKLNEAEDIMNETFEETWISNKQDDEISKELRELQRQLKIVNLKNNLRKKVLFKKVYEEISFREFYNILENLNKQIDQYYLKKQKILVRHHKKHKKTSTPMTGTITATVAAAPHDHEASGSLSHQQVIDKTLNSLIEKRGKWVEKIGPLFNYTANIQLRPYPSESVFNDKVAKITEENFDEFYEIYSEFLGNDRDEFDDDDDEEAEESSNHPDGILLAEGIKIERDELKLDDSKEAEVNKRFKAVKVQEAH